MSIHHSIATMFIEFISTLALPNRRMLAAAVAVTLAGSGTSLAATVWDQGFETDTSGWFDETSGWAGTVTRVSSGTNGITSSEGSFHAEVTQTVNEANTGSTDPTGPFSRFDMYRDTWPGGLTASIDIYLNTSWAPGEGFDYSVAANGSDGNHEQDFIFHVTKDTSTGDLLVGGSNNTNFDPREDLETINHYVVPSTGWYTFEHVFKEDGDATFSVDMNLRDNGGGGLLFTENRPITDGGSDVTLAQLGGNRYSWFTNIDISGGIAVDGHSLSVVPEPTSLALLSLAGLCGLVTIRRRRRA